MHQRQIYLSFFLSYSLSLSPDLFLLSSSLSLPSSSLLISPLSEMRDLCSEREERQREIKRGSNERGERELEWREWLPSDDDERDSDRRRRRM